MSRDGSAFRGRRRKGRQRRHTNWKARIIVKQSALPRCSLLNAPHARVVLLGLPLDRRQSALYKRARLTCTQPLSRTHTCGKTRASARTHTANPVLSTRPERDSNPSPQFTVKCAAVRSRSLPFLSPLFSLLFIIFCYLAQSYVTYSTFIYINIC